MIATTRGVPRDTREVTREVIREVTMVVPRVVTEDLRARSMEETTPTVLMVTPGTSGEENVSESLGEE